MYSRRLSLIIGFALLGAGFIFEGAFPIFWTILLSQVVLGIGFTFTSGARQAWLADELGDDEETARVFVRGTRFEIAGSLVGIGLSVALASVFVSLSLLVGGAMFILLAVGLVATLPEAGFRGAPSGERESWGKVGRRRVTPSYRSTFPSAPLRTGRAAFTASGSPVSLQSGSV